ncbi:MAG: GGDEF domain-containing protein [Actinomycetota bacterium]|nr:GGDEF domain-containing protein [Actinomycetota bacterium]
MRLMPVLASQAGAVIKRTDRLASLTELAGKDPLTGLPNRRFWDEEVQRTLSLAGRHGTPVCVVVLDVNGLKQVNDLQGHQAGDALLRDAARSWEAQLRAEDLLARLGGDEFGVLVPGLRRAAAEAIVRRLTEAAPHLSAAAGVVEWDGAESAAQLIHRADEAMYVDKRAR